MSTLGKNAAPPSFKGRTNMNSSISNGKRNLHPCISVASCSLTPSLETFTDYIYTHNVYLFLYKILLHLKFAFSCGYLKCHSIYYERCQRHHWALFFFFLEWYHLGTTSLAGKCLLLSEHLSH